MSITVGLGGMSHHGCAALSTGERVLRVCEQERVTRVRGAGCNGTGVPDEALDAILADAGIRRSDIARCAVAEDGGIARQWPTTRLDRHHAHACAAYLTSPFDAAVVVVCDRSSPGVSVWKGRGREIAREDWSWSGPSPSHVYGECARLLGFEGERGEQRFEALARLMADEVEERIPTLFSTDGTRIVYAERWSGRLLDLLTAAGRDINRRARLAAGLQRQIADLLLDLLAAVQRTTGSRRLCLGGGLFFHSSLNTAVRTSPLFERVHIPIDPGETGLSVGAALHVSQLAPAPLSAFMGPSYDGDTIKSTLDNCKLSYTWLDESAVVDSTVKHLLQGRLVGWFEGRMEWGARALGARSILANPFDPYVLDNLNLFLKRRDPWRGYALSALPDDARTHFAGPEAAPYMECDYQPLDVDRFRPVLPATSAHLRVQTVTDDCPPRFRSLLQAFGQKTGIACLVNTSFNGFHEPIVCTPRDAVRVFFGSGLDVLVLDRFALSK